MRVLYVTTVGATMRFFRSFIKELKKEGHDVEIATNQCASEIPDMYKDINCGSHHIDCTRSPFSFGNLIAILQLRKLIKNGEYNIVHCHTPIASVCTRVANKLVGQKNKTNVIYTAHGFHFYKGAPLLNWLIYFHWSGFVVGLQTL